MAWQLPGHFSLNGNGASPRCDHLPPTLAGNLARLPVFPSGSIPTRNQKKKAQQAFVCGPPDTRRVMKQAAQ
jgi:hypothetical protein